VKIENELTQNFNFLAPARKAGVFACVSAFPAQTLPKRQGF
jgi:hypothetical protein